MRIAILNTNTDRSLFAQRWPDDVEKFTSLLKELRPSWCFTGFDLTQSEIPQDPSLFDAYLITGSPASVNSQEAWIQHSIVFAAQLIQMEIPIFGACFGHQLLSKAMGVDVVNNPGGWVLGTIETHLHTLPSWLSDEKEIPKSWAMYGAHAEQASGLPKGTTLMCGNNECQIGGFYKGSSIFSTQYHPEMTHEFIQALVNELKGVVSADVFEQADDSLSCSSDRQLFAKWIVRFFESGK